ncbi:MAG TPA: XdhC family protein [Limnochordales bacterium]|nr:XdhC family protein [Limnochordales bacterium]
MKPLHEVEAQLARLRQEGQRAVLATVVHVVGSAYRREGAKMVVAEDGRTFGTISGGCLEGAVREAARAVLAEGRPRLLHFDMTADDDLVWGLGLGCHGRIDVFLEPVGGGGR